MDLTIHGSLGGVFGSVVSFQGSVGGCWGLIVTLFIVYYRYLMHFISEFRLANSCVSYCLKSSLKQANSSSEPKVKVGEYITIGNRRYRLFKILKGKVER